MPPRKFKEFVPFGEYLPDQPDFDNPGNSKAFNVVPATVKSYGPFPSMTAYAGNALGSRAQGALATLDKNGDVSIIAGDGTDLWQLVPGSTSFNKVSKSAGAYTVPADGRWSMCQYGQIVLAADINDNVQAFTLNVSAAFADLAGSPPKAKYVASVKNFVMLGFTNDPTNGLQPQRAWWSGINDSTSWPTPGTSAALAVQSDFNDFPGNQGWLQGLAPDLVFADVALFFERGVYRGTYVGSPNFFDFAPAVSIRGTPAPGAIVQLGNIVYYLGQDGFYAFDGMNAVPIGAQKVDSDFFTGPYALDTKYYDRVSGAVDPITKIVYWAYPDGAAANGIPNRILCYHTTLNRWSLIIDQVTELLFQGLSIGYTLEGLSPGLYSSLASIPFPIDSRVWTGGALLLGGFDNTHTMGFFNGQNLAPTVETTENQIFPDSRAIINNARPAVDGGTPSVAMGTRNRLEDAVTYSGAVAMNSNGDSPQRVEGRYVRASVTLPTNTTFTHMQGVEITATSSGRR